MDWLFPIWGNRRQCGVASREKAEGRRAFVRVLAARAPIFNPNQRGLIRYERLMMRVSPEDRFGKVPKPSCNMRARSIRPNARTSYADLDPSCIDSCIISGLR